ncbi:hypothetical protein ISU10_03465 [Nocardioides agariphilus]|uniref:PKD domain-containing protein n=1 Tax=Nocardioides agariphilus TaxID=433664 RepID=A0A930VN01_9ACTN|nr:MBG domain-containing protein [Nocardioides agariphilus]MBF4766825.1 hypothetical protein [Nocardioides agariphilus]
MLGLVLATLAGLLHLSWGAVPAQAATVTSDFAPPALLNPRVVAKAATPHAAALRSIQDKAVQQVLAHHGLPATDRDAVLSWGRDEALATMWGLMIEAVQTDPGQRTAEQEALRDWLATEVWTRMRVGARSVGQEYVAWMGVDAARFEELFSRGTLDELRAFLAPPDTVHPCDYTPPAPFEAENFEPLQSHADEICADGAENGVTCWYDLCAYMPSFEQFTRWGAARQHTTQWDTGLERGVAAVGAAAYTRYLEAVAQAGNSSAALSPVARGGAAIALHTEASAAGTPGSALVDHSSQLTALAPWASASFADLNKRIIAADAALLRALVVGANPNDRLWGNWMAALIVEARRKPAPEAMLAFADSQTVLFSVFVEATLPQPRTEVACDNTLIPVPDYGISDFMWLLAHPTSTQSAEERTPCLNRSPIPEADPAGLQFVVRPDGTDQRIQTPSISVRYLDSGPGFLTPTTSTVRLDGQWFVQDVTKRQSSEDVQSLSLTFQDWEGRRNVVSVVGDPKGGFRFAGIKDASAADVPMAETCRSKFLCWTSDSIRYVDADGHRHEAWVRPFQGPSGQPWHSLAEAGAPAQFEANGFAPAYLNGASTYRWRFQTDDCRGLCTTADGDPVYAEPVAGESSTVTWSAPGMHLVELTATDAAGQVVVTTIKVPVAPAAPVLMLPVCAPSHDEDWCSPRRWEVGRATLVGTIRTVGALDVAEVGVDWGDGTPVKAVRAGPDGALPAFIELEVSGDGAGSYQLSALHDYARPGTYSGSVVVRDIFGTTTTMAFTEVVGLEQRITMTPLETQPYGARFTPTATGGGSTAPVSFTASPASVCTASGANGAVITLVGVGNCTVTANQGGDARYRPALPVSSSFWVKQAPLVIEAGDQSVAVGDPVATDHWSARGWVNGDDESALTSRPACRVESIPSKPGVYPDLITCSGAKAANYSISYTAGTLTVDPQVTMRTAGLPADLAQQGVADGQQVNLPMTLRAVAFGSSHTYAFRRFVAEKSGLLHITTHPGTTGPVTDHLDLVATYRTMAELGQAAVQAGAVSAKRNDSLAGQWSAVEAAILAGQQPEAATAIIRFVDDLSSLERGGLLAPELQALVDHARAVAEGL